MRHISYDATDRICGHTHLDIGSGSATAAAQALNEASSTVGMPLPIDAPPTYCVSPHGRIVLCDAVPTDPPAAATIGGTTGGTTGASASSLGATSQLAGGSAGSNALAGTSTPQAALRTVYVYGQQGELLGEYDAGSGAIVREYVWLQGMPVAIIDGTPAAPVVYYVQTDHIDTPRVLLDRAGRQRWSWVAEPFGNSAPIEDPIGAGAVRLNLRMPGQYFDEESGLSYNWNRAYDAGIGRYTQSDPIGLQGGINTYAYVESNPLSYVDPDGLQIIIPIPGRRPGGMRDPDFPPGVGPNQSPAPTLPSWSRDIWWPDRKSGQWSCKARADCNDNIPGNCPDDPSKRFSFGGGTANDLGTARNIAKANATSNLQCQPKHVSCKCTGPKGEQYSGGC